MKYAKKSLLFFDYFWIQEIWDVDFDVYIEYTLADTTWLVNWNYQVLVAPSKTDRNVLRLKKGAAVAFWLHQYDRFSTFLMPSANITMHINKKVFLYLQSWKILAGYNFLHFYIFIQILLKIERIVALS